MAARMWRLARVAAEGRRVNGRIRPYDQQLLLNLIDELVDLMSYTYLLRMRLNNRRRKVTKRARIELASPVHQQAKIIADAFDLDLGNIRKRFEPIAGSAIKKSVKDIRDVMNRALAKATKDQLPTPAATKAVLKAVRKHGVQPRSSVYVETLVRTHSAISYGAAHRLSYQGDVDLWGFEYLTVGDDRVRPEHEKLDGIRRKADDEFWDTFWPPNGWNCRCQAVALYGDENTQTRIPRDVQPYPGFEGDFTDLF